MLSICHRLGTGWYIARYRCRIKSLWRWYIRTRRTLFTVLILGCLVVICCVYTLNTHICSIANAGLMMGIGQIVDRTEIHVGPKGEGGVGKALSPRIPNNAGHLVRKISGDNSVNSFKDSRMLPVNGRNEATQHYQEMRNDRYKFDCSNVHLIRLQKTVGYGVSKETFEGEYNGHQVAVKIVTRNQEDVTVCLSEMSKIKGRTDEAGEVGEFSQRERSKCYIFPRMKLMKEVLLLEQLNHPSIVKLLGHCVRSEEIESTDLSEHGVIVIEEFGSRLILCCLESLPWYERLRHAKELANLLNYLEYSPMGSLILGDFKESHFLVAGSSIKLVDLDDVNSVEPPCWHADHVQDGSFHEEGASRCDFGLPCRKSRCIGYNAKINLKNMREVFYKRLLLLGSFPEKIAEDISDINVKLDDLSINAYDLYTRLRLILSSIE